MKAKTFGLFALSIFALVFLMGAVSATLSFIPPQINQTILHDQTSTTFNFQLNETSGNPFNLTWTRTSTTGILTLSTQPASITANQILSLSATLSNIPSDFLGTITGNITVGGGSVSTTLPISIIVTAPQEVLDCFTTGTLEELEIRDIDFTNNGMSHATFGDDNEWFPFEEIEVEIDIKNDGDFDIDDIEVSWGLYDVDAGEWIIDFDEEDEFNIKDGDTETLIISFKLDDDLDVDLEDLSDNTDNYRLYVVADGTIDDSGSSNDGQDTCAFDYKSASMIIENDFVILDNIDMPETVQCGENVQVTADVWNIGDDDQDDVYVLVKSNELGINNKKIEIGDIDEFDNAPFNFDFQVPEDAEEKTYSIRFTVYDEDNDIYENDYDDDESVFSVFLKVEGNCAVDSEVLISASLESEAKAGKEMVISVLLTNTADVTRSFTMQASGYDAWAELSELPGLLTINADSVGEALLKLDLKKGISGEQTFLVMVYSDNELIATQPVSVNVESARPFLGITGLVTTDNAYLWGIGL
ncbi:MAG: putative S-layer protein, partial [Candidatus Heimdallarchaeota archaeon]